MKPFLMDLVSGVCGGLVVIVAQWAMTTSVPTKSGMAESITAKRLTIVDDNGVERIKLTVDSKNQSAGARVTCCDNRGKRVCELIAGIGGQVSVFDPEDDQAGSTYGASDITLLAPGKKTPCLWISPENIVAREHGKVVWSSRPIWPPE